MADLMQCLRCGLRYARTAADGRCHACGATVRPIEDDLMQQARGLLAAEIGAPVTAGSFAGTLPAGVHADAAVRAIAAALRAVPEGFVLVPMEPTPEMLDAAASFGGRGGYSAQRGDDAVEIWADMLAARPQGVKDAP